jgi:putative FmdB family regulatory protein
MPTYDYICQACGHDLDIFQSMADSPKRKCPKCGKLKLKRQIGMGAGILFKGSGFYETDYRSDSYNKGAKAETESKSKAKKTDSSKTASSESGKSEGAKPEGAKKAPKKDS